jgi:hypothetical protein
MRVAAVRRGSAFLATNSRSHDLLGNISVGSRALENPKTVNEKLAQLDQRVTAAQSSAEQRLDAGKCGARSNDDRTGLALFYGGWCGEKHTGDHDASFALMALITVMWALVGYSVLWRERAGDRGFEHAFLRVWARAGP